MKLFVCGTPFSGISVVGKALADANVFLGGPLGLPLANEAVGLFINRQAAALHNEIFASAAGDWLSPAPAPFALDEKHWQRASALLADHAGDRRSWAIIDPRAVLFTDLWHRVAPDAQWVFVVRRPAESAWVYLRRGLFTETEPSPMRRLARGLTLWNRYARTVVECCQRSPDRSTLLLAPDDFGPTGDALLAALPGGGPTMALADAYHSFLLRTMSPAWVQVQARLDGDVARTMEALREIRAGQLRKRGIPGGVVSSRAAAGNGQMRTVCVATRRRLAISETFIRDHLRHLPASIRWLVGGTRVVKRDKDDVPVNNHFERGLAAGLGEFGFLGNRIEARGVARYLRREGVNVVLAEFGPVAVEYIDACQAAGIPLVAHFHGYDAYKRSILVEYRESYRRLFDTAAVLVVVSRDMVRQLESLGAPPEKIVWSPCGVDIGTFQGACPEHAPPLFLAVGRFVEKKAPHYVLQAFHQVATRCPDARLVMVGDGILLDPCRRLCEALGLGERVSFTGTLSPAEVASYMRSARAFVQHSIRDAEGNAEGTPVSVLEAGASSLPVVGSRHMGIADVVLHGETGLLVDEGDIDGMAAHMITLCEDAALADRLGRSARARVCAEYSMERSISRLWSALETAMERQRRTNGSVGQ